MSLRRHARSVVLRAKHIWRRPLRRATSGKALLFLWWDTRNWGDALNPILISQLSGKPACGLDLREDYPITGTLKDVERVLVVGSVLQYADRRTVVWGAGFLRNNQSVAQPPMRICAVRGPLSRARLLALGIDCPEVYGDPALLYPVLYRPRNIRKRFPLGIVPHFMDYRSSLLKKWRNQPDVLVINIKRGVKPVVDAICSCERIASSSLHGLIAADAYGVPSTWIKLSDKLVGDGFKFHDYFESVGRTDRQPLLVTHDTTLNEIYDSFHSYQIDIDLERLFRACPFGRTSDLRTVCSNL